MVVRVQGMVWSQWAVVLLLALSHMMAFVDRFVMSVIAAPLKRAFSLTDTELGALQGLAFAMAYAAVVLPLGRLADRVAPKLLIVGGMVVWTLASASCAFAGSFGSIFAARMVMGMGQAAFTPAALAVIGGLVATRAAAGPLSVFTAGSTMGKSVALLAGGAAFSIVSAGRLLHGLSASAPWRSVFVLTAAPNLVLIALLMTVQDCPQPMRARQLNSGVADWLRQDGRSFFSHAAVAIAPIILIQAAAAWTPIFYTRYFGLGVGQSALLVGGVVLVAAPLGHLVGGQATMRLVRRGVAPGVVVAAILILAAPVAAVFCFSPLLYLSLGAYGLLVLLLGVAAPAGLAGVRLLTPRRHLGAGNGVFMGLTTLIGVGFAPTLVGWMNDRWFGGDRGLNLSLITLVIGVSVLGAILALVFARGWTQSAQVIEKAESGVMARLIGDPMTATLEA